MIKSKNNKIEYGYYININGLHYVSTRSGKPYENFDINGVVCVNEYPGINMLYLCYLEPNEND